jgi:hypothetical protein
MQHAAMNPQRYSLAGSLTLTGETRSGESAAVLRIVLSTSLGLHNGDPETLLFSMTRFFRFLPGDQRQAFLEGLSENAS